MTLPDALPVPTPTAEVRYHDNNMLTYTAPSLLFEQRVQTLMIYGKDGCQITVQFNGNVSLKHCQNARAASRSFWRTLAAAFPDSRKAICGETK